jgi:sulfopyruvate decarboxylase subunit alpha
MPVIDGPTMVEFFRAAEVTHLVWIPDSAIGAWDEAVSAAESLEVVRPCREGEVIGVAAGLWLGGKRPVVAIQSTGFFEAGDALRNVVYDLEVPLFLFVGYRSYRASRQGGGDSAARFIEPILDAWGINWTLLDAEADAAALAERYRRSQQSREAHVLLLAE